jgi:nucleoid DNA-binding protein
MAAKKLTAVKDRMTKAQIISEIADTTGVTKIGVKLKRVNKPATKARKGINPFTGQPMMFKAKKASTSVRAVALKACKDMASAK